MPLHIVLVSVPDSKTAGKIARGLVERKLAACASQVGGVVSHYIWEGKLHKDRETLLIIKTDAKNLKGLIAYVRKNHPAKVPEIIALPITAGHKPYLDWLKT